MGDAIEINVTDVIGSNLCVSAEDGKKVFNKIKPLVKEGKNVRVLFNYPTLLISLFLNVAIGQLYGSFKEEVIKSQLRVDGLAEDDMELLKIVVDNAKKYYSNSDAYDKAWQEENGDQE